MKKHLLYINLDGFAWSLFAGSEERYPVLSSLAASSLFFTSCYSSVPSITVPMQVGIVTGKKPKDTGNCFQYFDRERGEVRATGRTDNAMTVAELLSSHNMRVLSLQQFAVEDHGCTRDDLDHLYIQPGGDAEKRFEILQEYYRELKVPGHSFSSLHDMVLFYADDLDGEGHNYRNHKETEEDRIEGVRKRLDVIDREIGKTLEILEEKGILSRMTILITSDHGMVHYYTPSMLPLLIKDLAEKTGLTVSASTSPLPDILLLPSTIECQGYILSGNTDEKKVLAAARSLDYVEKVMGRKELEEEGAMKEFGDFLISPKKGCAFYNGGEEIPEGVLLASHDSLNEEAQHVFALIYSSGEQHYRENKRIQIHDLMDIALGLSSLPVLNKNEEWHED